MASYIFCFTAHFPCTNNLDMLSQLTKHSASELQILFRLNVRNLLENSYWKNFYFLMTNLEFRDKSKVLVFNYLKFEKHPRAKQNFIFCHRILKSDSKASIFINFLFSKLDLEGVCNLLRKTNCHLSWVETFIFILKLFFASWLVLLSRKLFEVLKIKWSIWER